MAGVVFVFLCELLGGLGSLVAGTARWDVAVLGMAVDSVGGDECASCEDTTATVRTLAWAHSKQRLSGLLVFGAVSTLCSGRSITGAFVGCRLDVVAVWAA